ncbi:hypothetical protein AB837_00593 [bacterium AB1]|nr:hypothetical protein AB837_00593 [bacterium AB1]
MPFFTEIKKLFFQKKVDNVQLVTFPYANYESFRQSYSQSNYKNTDIQTILQQTDKMIVDPQSLKISHVYKNLNAYYCKHLLNPKRCISQYPFFVYVSHHYKKNKEVLNDTESSLPDVFNFINKELKFLKFRNIIRLLLKII